MNRQAIREFQIRRGRRVHLLELRRIRKRAYIRLHPNNKSVNIAQCSKRLPGSVSFSRKNNAYRIHLPEMANLSTSYLETVSTIYTLRDGGSNRRNICNLDFSKMSQISPAAALLLAAEIDLWNRRCKGKLKAATHTWQPAIRKLLFQMGFFKLLKKDYNPSQDETETALIFLEFKSGQVGITDGGPIFREFRKQIECTTKKAIEKQALFSALTEALTNVSQHAYPGLNHNGSMRWWVCGSYDQVGNRLTIIFYDQGVGIPKTLRPSRLPEYLASGFGRMKDSERIEAAMEYGRSSTKDPSRGKGLPDFLGLLNLQNKGKLRIFSRKGLCSFRKNTEGRVETAEKINLELPIKGTLIEWIIEL